MDVLMPRSSVPGVTWPGLPGTAGVTMLAPQYPLEQSHWWPPEGLLRQRFRQLRHVLLHGFRTIPFYRDRLAEAGLAPDRPLTPDIWAKIPVLTRTKIQEAGGQVRRFPRRTGVLTPCQNRCWPPVTQISVPVT